MKQPPIPTDDFKCKKVEERWFLTDTSGKETQIGRKRRKALDGQCRLGDSTVMIDVDMTHYNQFVVLNCCCFNNRRHFHSEIVQLG